MSPMIFLNVMTAFYYRIRKQSQKIRMYQIKIFISYFE